MELVFDLVVVAGRHDHLHPLTEQRPEARPRLHDRVPILGLLVPPPVESAEIIDDAEVRRSGEIGETSPPWTSPTCSATPVR